MAHLTIVKEDTDLLPYETYINNRLEWYYNTLDYIKRDFDSLQNFASAHHFFGFNYDKERQGWWFREWLPHADYVSLIGDFNQWNRNLNPLEKVNFGVWETFLPDAVYATTLVDQSLVKIHVSGQNGQLDRIPAFIKRVVQNETLGFDGQFLKESTFNWTDQTFNLSAIQHPLIYEAHIGMAQDEEKVGSYREFTLNILPRIKALGYNTIQLMAIQEHPYYGSFGYHVTNFYAPSSRFGTPDELRELINTAHNIGLAVIIDIVHSHAAKNRDEGLSEFDGTEIYFDGWHPAWDSRLFDYGRIEVKRFLTSNLKYWIDEFHFDGFRFDGVTSMLYHNHGLTHFTSYEDYFNKNLNNDAILYLQLANTIIHETNPHCISICEDMSGMPGACRAIEDGGLGFDYRLGMGIPDFWTTLLDKKSDDQWHMGDLFWNLTNRRFREKTIAYTESHDQALVGDKTLAFWLMDKAMYTHMSVLNESLTIDRGIALHKLIRLVTILSGGEGYLNFMGNEFGHPEWIDFPRPGNNWSYHHAQRKWHLVDSDHLKYKFLNNFDKAMIQLVTQYNLLDDITYKIHEDNLNKILIFSKKDFIFIFNFGHKSLAGYTFHLSKTGKYNAFFSTDSLAFGGFDRVDYNYPYETKNDQLTIYIPNQTALILKPLVISI